MVRVPVGASGELIDATEETGALAAELDALVQALWTWSPSRWNADRVEAARALAEQLVALTAEAGAPAPPGARLPDLAPFGLADEIAVVGADLLAAPDAPRAAAQARRCLAAAREVLLVPTGGAAS